MSVKCGIVGLPNVGKSTLFNALTEAGIQAENYPFCTIDPNVGIVSIPDPRLDNRSIADVLRSFGGEIRESWCGPCFGQGPDALTWGQRAITSFNRNWQNRMGVGGQGYLASPAVVAASALLGYMAPPSELGIGWNPEIFGI